MQKVTIYAGEKLNGFMDGQVSVSFECEPDDVDTVYTIIAESIVLKDQSEDSQDLIAFQNCTDDDVETMLKDLKHMDFLADFDEEEVKD